jgi:hypothetical protein
LARVEKPQVVLEKTTTGADATSASTSASAASLLAAGLASA